MSDKRKDLPPANTPQFLQQVREAVSTYLGTRGDRLDRGVTVRDLVDAGLVELNESYLAGRGKTPIKGPGSGLGGGNTTIVVPGEPGGGDPYEPDLTPPPTPTGVTVSAGIDFLMFVTDPPLYLQGHGHSRTRVFGATWVPGPSAKPTFSDAVEITQFLGNVDSYPTNPATEWHIWLKWVTNDGVESAVPSGGTNGHVATTGRDPTLLLKMLDGQIKQEQLYADLGARIDLIDAPDTAPGSVAARIKSEATARANADNAISSIVDQVSATVDGNTAAIQTEATTRANQTGQLFAQYTVKLDVGGKVSGYGLASSNTSSTFAIRADRFYIAAPAGVGGVNDVVPFAVQATPTMTPAGELLPAGVYIDAAYVRNLEVALGRFQNAFITNAMVVSLSASRLTSGVISVGNYIQSSNYIPGVQGWRIHGDGSAEFAAAVIRGQLSAAQMNGFGLSIYSAKTGQKIIDAGADVPIPSSMVNPAAGWLNSNVTAGKNLLPNSDQVTLNFRQAYTPNGATIDRVSLSDDVPGWSTANYVLSGGQTKSATFHQPGYNTGWGDPSASNGRLIAADFFFARATQDDSSVAVVGGSRIIASAYLNTHRCDAQVWIQCLDAAGNAITYGASPALVNLSTNANTLASFSRLSCVIDTPANTARVALFIRKYDTYEGTGDSWVWVAAPMVEIASAQQTAPSPYNPGPASSPRQLGYTGDLNADTNSKIGINSSGQFYGGGAGTGTTVSNNQLSMGADGVLYNAGSPQGRVEQVAVVDNGPERTIDRPPSWYGTATRSEFKMSSAIGLKESDGYWCMLETLKQYPDNSGGTAYQYAYQDGKTWRRNAPVQASSWGAWTQDLDRNTYTGDLNASAGISLVNHNGMGVSGSTVTKLMAIGGWNASVYSKDSYTGGAFVSWKIAVNGNHGLGLNTDPTSDANYQTIDWWLYVEGGGSGAVYVFSNGTNVAGPLTYAGVGDVMALTFDGTTVRASKNGTVIWSASWISGGSTSPLFLDSSFDTVGCSVSNIQFGPMTSNNWSAVGGAGKPQDNATVGATVGLNLGGSFDQSSFDIIMAGRSLIRAAHIQSLSVDVLSTTLNGGSAVGLRAAANQLSCFDEFGARRTVFGKRTV